MADVDAARIREIRATASTEPREEETASAPRPASATSSWWPVVLPAAAAIALGLGTVRLLWEAARALAVVVPAIALAAALAPIVNRLARQVSRTTAVVIVYLAGTALLAGLGWYIVPTLHRELQDIGSRAPQLVSTAQDRLGAILPPAAQSQQVIDMAMRQLTTFVQQVSSAFASLVFELLVIVFLSLYLLTVSPRIHWFLINLFPRGARRRASFVLCRMATEMGGYFRGVAIDAAIIGVLTGLTLTIIGVEFAVPLAVLAALAEFIPYIGPILAAIPAVAAGLLQSPQQALIIAGAYLAIQQIESHIVTPNIMHSQTSIRPAAVIVALTVGYAVGGVLGAIVAIPIFAAAQVLVLRAIAPAVRKAARGR